MCEIVPCIECFCLVVLALLLQLDLSGLEAIPRGDTVPEVALAEWLGMDQVQVRGNSCGELCPRPLGAVVVTELGLDWWQSLGRATPKAVLAGWLVLVLKLARDGEILGRLKQWCSPAPPTSERALAVTCSFERIYMVSKLISFSYILATL